MHPTTGKIFALLQWATPDIMEKDKKKILEGISEACHICQTYSPKPINFQARIPEEVIFNREVRPYLMFLGGHYVLHGIGTATNFSAADFIAGEVSATVWNSFIKIWVSIDTGFPNNMLVDQGSVFNSIEWKSNCQSVNIQLKSTGTEQHNSFGAGETYHAYLQRI